MKKVFVVLLAVMMLALTACGGGKESSSTGKKATLEHSAVLCDIPEKKDREEHQTDLTIVVDYPTTREPDVAFISPSGRVYQRDEDFYEVYHGLDAINSYEGGRRIQYFIEDPEAGTWYIEYSKNGNEEIDVTVAFSQID